MDAALAVILGIGTLLIRLGMGFHQAGMLRAKNAAGAVMRTVTDVSVGVLAVWAIGGALFFGAGATPVITFAPSALFMAGSFGGDAAGAFLLVVVVLLAGGILTGVLAERTRFFPAVALSAVLMGLLIPVAAYWVRHPSGWLGRWGYVDVAGGTFIHLPAAVFALVASVAVGPRNGKYNRDGSSNAIPGHNLPLASLGILLMAVSWVPYVLMTQPVALLAPAAMNVLVAGAAGALASLTFCHLRYGKPDVHLTFDGLLGALVAISVSGGLVSSLGAFLIGAVAGLIIPVLTLTIDLLWKIDDPIGAIAIHGGGGLWGGVAVAIFARGGTFGEHLALLGRQVVGMLAITALALGVGLVSVWALKALTTLRSREADEYDGLDLAEHDIGAYPDFQQTMIKSYHLREA